MMIMNERTFVEDCICGRLSPNEVKMSRARMVSLLSSFFHNDPQKIPDITILMEGFYQEEFVKEYWTNLIEKVVRVQGRNNKLLIEREYIPIYQSDIDTVQKLQDEAHQKLIFAAFVLARYQDKNGWIGLYKPTDIKAWFDLANVKKSPARRYMMIGELERSGYLTGAKKNDNINERISLDHDDVEVMQIHTLSNLGNQYLEKYKEGWKMCESCKKMIRIAGRIGRPKKYCDKCSKIMHQKQDREYQRRKRSR